jgi:TonB dependent receptor
LKVVIASNPPIRQPACARPRNLGRTKLPINSRTGSDLNSTSAKGDRDIIAGFGELYAPLVSSEMAIPGINSLEAQLALRGEYYGDFGSTVNPKTGLASRPVPDWVLLRASYSTGFRAPSLVQSSTGSLTFSQELQDTRRFEVTGAPEDESQSIQILSGGNPNLDAEDSENFSAGFVLTPPVVPGALTLSADFFHIEIDGLVGSLDPQFILDDESDFPGFVVRAPPSAGDQALDHTTRGCEWVEGVLQILVAIFHSDRSKEAAASGESEQAAGQLGVRAKQPRRAITCRRDE